MLTWLCFAWIGWWLGCETNCIPLFVVDVERIAVLEFVEISFSIVRFFAFTRNIKSVFVVNILLFKKEFFLPKFDDNWKLK